MLDSCEIADQNRLFCIIADVRHDNMLLPTPGAELMQAEEPFQWEPGAWILYQLGAIRCVFKSKWQTGIVKLNDILQTLRKAVMHSGIYT